MTIQRKREEGVLTILNSFGGGVRSVSTSVLG